MRFEIFDTDNNPVTSITCECSLSACRQIAQELLSNDPTAWRCEVIDDEDETLVLDLRMSSRKQHHNQSSNGSK